MWKDGDEEGVLDACGACGLNLVNCKIGELSSF